MSMAVTVRPRPASCLVSCPVPQPISRTDEPRSIWAVSRMMSTIAPRVALASGVVQAGDPVEQHPLNLPLLPLLVCLGGHPYSLPGRQRARTRDPGRNRRSRAPACQVFCPLCLSLGARPDGQTCRSLTRGPVGRLGPLAVHCCLEDNHFAVGRPSRFSAAGRASDRDCAKVATGGAVGTQAQDRYRQKRPRS